MSEKPVAERLQVKTDRRLAVLNAPSSIDETIGVSERHGAVSEAEVILLFAANRAQLEADLPSLLETARPDAILWLAYPKLTSPLAADLNRDLIRNLVLSSGLETVSQIAIDQDWSALRVKRVR